LILYGNKDIKGIQRKTDPTQLLKKQNEILEIFRRSLALRGAYGIVGIARCFRVMDNNLDKTISIVEFQQACKDFKIQLTADDIIFIFNQFDWNKDGRLDYDEFLRGVRGEMNAQWRTLAE